MGAPPPFASVPERPSARVFEVSQPVRIDRLLARDLPLSRTRVQELLEQGAVTVDGRVVRRSSFVPETGSVLTVVMPEAEPVEAGPEGDSIPLDVLHEDDAILVLNKPAGLVVHPAPGHSRGTLVNALIARGSLSAAGGQRPGIVHRLDRETSGVMVVARDDEAQRMLGEQFKARTVTKAYEAVAWGHLAGEAGSVERPIARSRTDRLKMAVDHRRGRAALTRWRRLARFDVADHLELDLASGRTHQIRVHLSSLGHPVVRDARYGGGPGVEAGFGGPQRALVRGALASIDRVALHSRRLELDHPRTGERMVFEAALPGDFVRLLAFLRGGGS